MDVVVANNDEEEREGGDTSAESGTPAPTTPKRRRTVASVSASAPSSSSSSAASASASAVAVCMMCQASGHAEVAARFMCRECTKASSGGEKMLYCEPCWSKAHWAPCMRSHAKSDPLSAPTVVVAESTGVRMCESHQLPLDVFCVTDSTFICSRCVFHSSHKGHHVVSVEDLTLRNQPSPKAFFGQLSKLEVDLNLLAVSIKSETEKIKLVQSQFDETINREFSDMIAQLQRRQEELLSTSGAIASSKIGALSKQLEILSVALEHIDKYKSKCSSTLRICDGGKILELCESIPGILKQLVCKPEHLSPCTGTTVTSANDIEPFKSKIPGLCFISPRPVLACTKEVQPTGAKGGGSANITLCGWWSPTAMNKDIRVRVGESECTNINIVSTGSVLTFMPPFGGIGHDLPVSLSVFGIQADRPNDTRFSFPGPEIRSVSKAPQFGGKITITGNGFGTSPSVITVSVNGALCTNVEVSQPHTCITCTVPRPPHANTKQAMMTLTVAGQHASSTVSFETWEWDTECCGNLLVIQSDDKSTVHKPTSSRTQNAQSIVAATTQLVGDHMYEWHLSISGLKGDQWVAYGVIQKPVDHNLSLYSDMYCWSTAKPCYRLPSGTLGFKATGGTEEVTLRYNAHTLTLSAQWPLHGNTTATVNNIPRGLYPAVEVYDHNTVKITGIESR